MDNQGIQKIVDQLVGTEGILRIPSWWMHKILSGIVTKIDKKQDTIEDIDSIREGASKGMTAIQEIPNNLATKEELSEIAQSFPSLDGYATKEWVESRKYLTEHQDISSLATKEDLNLVSNRIPSLDGYATELWVEDKISESLEQAIESSIINTLNTEV